MSDYSKEETNKFLESLDRKTFDKINVFFESMLNLNMS